jgi:alpha-tubulin suppressor-like RCC1 family protein
VNFTLNYAPATGTELMVVRNTGLGFITGTFNNLAQGQRVSLSFGGIAYDFVANYYGGSGNDLVLVWATNRAFAWGSNANGQLGDNSTTQPVLAGKTVLTISAGSAHSLALCSDGTVAAWGSNTYGQLGDNTTTQRLLPVAVNSASGVSALFGKTVIAISAGGWHSMALCSDGTVVAWGYNGSGQIGDNTSGPYGRLVPVAVNSTSGVSALFGKTVVAIGAGVYHSLALCSDGTVASWGHNDFGELGDNTTAYSRSAPVAVNTALSVSALFGKKVVAIATGQLHNLALCSDGTVVAWGSNNDGKLGDNTTTDRRVPVAVNTTSGVSALFGKTVVAIAAGGSHSIALCSDSTVAAWGFNAHGQLGDGTVTVTAPYGQPVPVAVNTALGVSALYDMAVVAISAGSDHSLALCSTGTVVAWGYNGSGQIGDNTTTQRLVPVPVSTTPLAAGERFTRVMSGSSASHTLALVAAPAPEIQIAANSVSIPDGGSQDFGNVAVGSNTSLVFTITNRGAIDLTGLGIMIDGADAAMFTVTANPVAPVSAAGGSTTFTVRFAPTTAGMKTAAIHIANNDPDENPFDIALTGNIGSPLQGWRLTNFGSVDNSGDGADLNDFDKDGIPNLNEFAFGLNPKSSSSGLLPTPQKSGSNLVVSFTEPVGVSGILYGAEWSQTLLAGSWTAVTDTGNTGASPPQHTFSVPIGTKTKLYMRLKVTNPNP